MSSLRAKTGPAIPTYQADRKQGRVIGWPQRQQRAVNRRCNGLERLQIDRLDEMAVEAGVFHRPTIVLGRRCQPWDDTRVCALR